MVAEMKHDVFAQVEHESKALEERLLAENRQLREDLQETNNKITQVLRKDQNQVGKPN